MPTYQSATIAINDTDEILYQSDRTLVFRRMAADSSPLICKQPLGATAAERVRHEKRILERLASVEGVPRLVVPQSANAVTLQACDAISLAEAMRRKSMELSALLAFALQLARILAAVHRAGVMHKDISPANILLCGEERTPMLIDFDLSATFAQERPAFVQPKEIVGTLAYLAPELTGRTGRQIDQRADMYALGAVLYELAVGHPPFAAEDPLQLIHDILVKLPLEPIETHRALPQAFSGMIMRLLEKEPDRRYQSAEGLAYDLSRLCAAQAEGTKKKRKEGETFVLGERDFPLRLLPPSRLIGRDMEIGALQIGFEQMLGGHCRGVLVSGAPGVGKSVLINELRTMVSSRHGWFAAGKSDQYHRDLTEDSAAQATRAFLRKLLAEPATTLEELRPRFLDSLGVNAGLLAAILPEISLLFNVTPDTATDTPNLLAERLIQAATGFFRATVSPRSPLVMVLDDLQWANQTTLGFVDSVMTDGSVPGLLLVCSYRETEIDATHPLAAILARWKRLDGALLELHLDNLPPKSLAELLAEMLRLPPAQSTRLAAAIAKRTGGNPFDTVELINALRREEVLVPGIDGWHWDETEIRRFIGKGDVIDLLAARIGRLPTGTRMLLENMACLGSEVGPALLAAAGGVSSDELEERLLPALEDGLLVTEGISGAVRFRHDRVQQAAYDQLQADGRRRLHLSIARRLAEIPEFKGIAAENYLLVVDAIDDAVERRDVVDLFHAAANQASKAAIYAAAERFLKGAQALLRTGTDKTEDQPLWITLETEYHSVLICLGHLDAADAVYQSLQCRCDDPLQLADAARMQISSLINRGRQSDALTLGFNLLRQIGLSVPEQTAVGAEVERRLDSFYAWAAELDLASDLARPEPASLQMLAAARIMNQMQPAAYYSDPAILAWLVIESQRLWAEHGPCAALVTNLSPAVALTILLRGDYRTGYKVVQHALRVSEARGYEPETSFCRHAFAILAQHWFEPLEDCVGEAQLAREGLLRGGELQPATYTYYTTIAALLDSAPLGDCHDEIEAGLALANRTGNAHAITCLLACRQLQRALRGETSAPGSFSDASYDETAQLAELGDQRLAYLHFNRALSAAVFGDSETLIQQAAAALLLEPYVHAAYPSALIHVLEALALAERIRTSTVGERAGLLAEFEICRNWLALRAVDAPINFLHLLKWIDAEQAWSIGDQQRALFAFDAALLESALHSRPWHRALMTERAGLFHLAHGLEQGGRTLLAEARRLYEVWGATAKVKEMVGHYDFLRVASEFHRKEDRRRSNSISTESIDLLAILRASQALSSETTFARLRLQMTTLLKELTGATHIRGAIWYEDRQQWCLPPPRDGGENAQPIPFDEAARRGLIALSVFNYIERTREPLLIADVSRDERFAYDSYFSGIERCSLLGVPVFNRDSLRFILVMENRLSYGAFTTDRLEAVSLIAGQIAISLDNTLLYDSLERKVAERTKALEAANLQLAALSTTDALTSLANRRRFDEMLEAEWSRAIRPQCPIGMALIDIDQFKDYNDLYGHQRGDECLRRVAQVLGESVRGDGDLVARYGGEEFVIVLPDTNLAATQVVAERARAAVAALTERHAKAATGIVTISVGVAALVPSGQNNSGQLVELADTALYRAKQSGRNRVMSARSS
jgi:diguanylate cyclase (GGDEF)-like protein